MDLTKALMLNGEMVLDKPLKVEKAKIKNKDKVKVEAPAEEKKKEKKGNSTNCFITHEFKFSVTCF